MVDGLLLTAGDAAKMLKISTRFFYSLHNTGRVPLPIRLGKSVRWRFEELRDWVRAGCPSREKWEGAKGD